MASPVPAKSQPQPLHNFSLPHLKWKKNHTNNHQRGRSKLADSSSPPPTPLHQSPSVCSPPSASRRSPMHDSAAGHPLSPPARQPPMRDSMPPRQSPMRDSAVRRSPMRDSSHRHSPMRNSSGPRLSSPMRDSTSDSDCGGGHGFHENRKSSYTDGVKTGLSGTNSDRLIEKFGKSLSLTDGVDAPIGGKELRSKIFIRLRKNNSKQDDVEEEEKEEKADEVLEDGKAETIDAEAEESVPKTWNLRPRKPIRKPPSVNGGASKVEHKAHQPPRATQIRQESEGYTGENKERKQKFSVSLSREEIEEDVFALTGSKAPRRPKKRAKIVQKQLDNLFPGMWLGMVSAEAYKVSENPS